jgi:hypothetical protein
MSARSPRCRAHAGSQFRMPSSRLCSRVVLEAPPATFFLATQRAVAVPPVLGTDEQGHSATNERGRRLAETFGATRGPPHRDPWPRAVRASRPDRPPRWAAPRVTTSARGCSPAPIVTLHLLIFPTGRPHLSPRTRAGPRTLAAGSGSEPQVDSALAQAAKGATGGGARPHELFGAVRRGRRSAQNAAAFPETAPVESTCSIGETEAVYCPSRPQRSRPRRAHGCSLRGGRRPRCWRPEETQLVRVRGISFMNGMPSGARQRAGVESSPGEAPPGVAP